MILPFDLDYELRIAWANLSAQLKFELLPPPDELNFAKRFNACIDEGEVLELSSAATAAKAPVLELLFETEVDSADVELVDAEADVELAAI